MKRTFYKEEQLDDLPPGTRIYLQCHLVDRRSTWTKQPNGMWWSKYARYEVKAAAFLDRKFFVTLC